MDGTLSVEGQKGTFSPCLLDMREEEELDGKFSLQQGRELAGPLLAK